MLQLGRCKEIKAALVGLRLVTELLSTNLASEPTVN
jgi:hypothetical protein